MASYPKMSKAKKEWWASLTQEEREAIIEKRRVGQKAHWESLSPLERKLRARKAALTRKANQGKKK